MTRRPDGPDRDGGLLSGWSRRKLAARRPDVKPPETTTPEDSIVGPDAAPEPDLVDADRLAALPPVETITAGTDIKPFLARGIPASLRNAALRRLWSATPGVRDYSDPAVDYAWDWNAPGGVPGGGGTLSRSGVAKMVKDLIGAEESEEGETPPETVTPVSDPGAEPPEADAETFSTLDEPAPVAVRRTEVPGAEPVGRDPSPDARRSAAPSPPPRRHGGAVPR